MKIHYHDFNMHIVNPTTKKTTKISKMKYRKQVNREDKMRTQNYSNNLKENKTKNSLDRK